MDKHTPNPDGSFAIVNGLPRIPWDGPGPSLTTAGLLTVDWARRARRPDCRDRGGGVTSNDRRRPQSPKTRHFAVQARQPHKPWARILGSGICIREARPLDLADSLRNWQVHSRLCSGRSEAIVYAPDYFLFICASIHSHRKPALGRDHAVGLGNEPCK